MQIKVICFGELTANLSGEAGLEVPRDMVAGDVPGFIGFNKDKVAMYFIGGKRVAADSILDDGDVLKIFPPITGG